MNNQIIDLKNKIKEADAIGLNDSVCPDKIKSQSICINDDISKVIKQLI